jgi:hypothetical protein
MPSTEPSTLGFFANIAKWVKLLKYVLPSSTADDASTFAIGGVEFTFQIVILYYHILAFALVYGNKFSRAGRSTKLAATAESVKETWALVWSAVARPKVTNQ